jgi:hypothetical protein
MKTITGWLATIGLSGGLVAAAVLAIGGGTAALHQSTLLSRSQPIPVVVQPASAASPSARATALPSPGGVDDNRRRGAAPQASASAQPDSDSRGSSRGSDDSGHNVGSHK